MFRSALLLALVLGGTTASLAADAEPPAIEKKVKAKKLEKLLAGSWRVYPVKEPELSQWLSGMASLDMSVDEIAAEYRLPPELAARLELAKATSPPQLPPQLQEMLRKGVTVSFDGQGMMTGEFGGEIMSGTYNVLSKANNRLEVNTRPKEGREDVIIMTWIDTDRMVWANMDDGGELAVARVR